LCVTNLFAYLEMANEGPNMDTISHAFGILADQSTKLANMPVFDNEMRILERVDQKQQILNGEPERWSNQKAH